MYILGVETSSRTGSAAIVSETSILSFSLLNIEMTYSERLMPTVDEVLRAASLSLNQLDGFAVSIGPGSFTGLRVGLSTIKGLAFATGKPVAAVPTLEALAWNLPFSSFPVCPMMDARKDEVYAALYRFENSTLVPIMHESAISLEGLCHRISGPAVFTGEAAYRRRPELQAIIGNRALFAPVSSCFPSAATVASLGLSQIKSGKQTNPDDLVPLYIRRPEAEVAWEKRQASK